jgi:branched-chain amino acid transport system substrate-binding protein
MMRGVKVAAAALLLLGTALLAACGGTAHDARPVAASSCTRLLYEGEGHPNLVVVSDFPLRGIGAVTTRSMVEAVEFVLRRHGFRAGKHRIGFQSCNDTVGDEPYDAPLCRRNARAYVAAEDVVAIIGPWNSGCAFEQIPIVSRRAAGPLAMISPTNTFIGLTRTVAGEKSGAALYRDGVRSYFRLVTHDYAQGIAAALLAARLNARRVVAIHQKLSDSYVRGLTESFVKAAPGLGLQTIQFEWALRSSYEGLAREVAAARPDVVYIAGLTQENAKTLVEDLRAQLGGRIPFIAPDSFAGTDIARGLGKAGEGMYVTVPGIPPPELSAVGKKFLRAFGHSEIEANQIGVPEAAQATEVLLAAIARSDGSRASVVEELFATKVDNGILGSFAFDSFGDIVPAPVGIYRLRNGDVVADDVIRAPLDAVGG